MPAVASGRARLLLVLASIAVAFAAADTYVVVLALPEMMGTAKIPIAELQRAAPIISGFLLGYVAMLPLIGRIADLRGRVPVLVMSLVVFAIGSLITALAYDLPSMVSGRFLQGVGGGGLVPATLALVADIYPAERRGLPLGVVSGVQELGSVLGPLFGALVLAFAPWQFIFGINLVAGVLLALAIRAAAGAHPAQEDSAPPGRPDWIGMLAAVVALGAAVVTMMRPGALQRDLTWGQLFIPYTGDGRWLTPIGVIAMGAGLVLLLRCTFARRPWVDLRAWMRHLIDADLVGALLLAVALGGVILAFATADPEVQVFSERGPWFLLGSAVATFAFIVHLRRAERPLIPRGAINAQPAWGSLLVSFFIGAALIAALIDIPIFARTTVHRDSQLLAALVLLRFLVALPIGAVIGGLLTRRWPSGVVTALGMLAAAAGFVLMTRWDEHALEHPSSTIALVLAGFGFGLALAPVNAALLASTADSVHGVAAALVVVARMIGMLVGISALTTIGVRWFYQANVDCLDTHPGKTSFCGTQAALAQEHTVFFGAAVCALVAAVLALWLFRGAATRGLETRELLRAAG
ncbi:MFS transporter [Nocardioides sp. JQ2195]|uniref:MFS transporter n=1 Tax=Nocardioides sp. JQ2195 TaxID=2592334 RepID=UPI00143E62CF|nr:MFS transporter [Nocardioides sp. JQ2195]QIX26443.1 MFS transporter [Nocardioides sp. JQ2195]